jgi:hypothetical protein
MLRGTPALAFTALAKPDAASMTNELDQPQDEQTAIVERREVRRYAFICPAELLDLGGDTRISARTADLSLHGCYIDTLNPFPVGTRVRLQILKNDRRVEFRAEVTSCHMGSGMGLIFEHLTPAQRDTVVSWLEGTSSPAEASFGASASSSASQGAAKQNARFAEKLLKILERKGVLTASEAADLLRDFNS